MLGDNPAPSLGIGTLIRSATRRIRYLIVLTELAAASTGIWLGLDNRSTNDKPRKGTDNPTVEDHRDRRLTPADFDDQWLLVFFGFSHCPDVCPAGMRQIAHALKQLDGVGDVLQPLMITVDPERDTPAVLADHVQYFHPAIVGLTGTPSQIAQVTARFRVYHEKVPMPESAGYGIDHSAFFYLITPERRFAAIYPMPKPPTPWPGTSVRAFAGVNSRTLKKAFRTVSAPPRRLSAICTINHT